MCGSCCTTPRLALTRRCVVRGWRRCVWCDPVVFAVLSKSRRRSYTARWGFLFCPIISVRGSSLLTCAADVLVHMGVYLYICVCGSLPQAGRGMPHHPCCVLFLESDYVFCVVVFLVLYAFVLRYISSYISILTFCFS